MSVRAFVLQVPESLLEERRRIGADRRDEVWEGVLHMVPPASGGHQKLSGLMFMFLGPIAGAKGLEAFYETGLFRSGPVPDYRVPDLLFCRPANFTKRGVDDGAELVIEILSPDDESYEKLPFYEKVGVREVLIVDPDKRTFDFFVLRGGKLHAALLDASGAVRSEALGVTFRTIAGPKLELSHGESKNAV